MTALLITYQTPAHIRLFAMAATILAITAMPCLAQNLNEPAAASESGMSLATDGRAGTATDHSSRTHFLIIGDNELSENAYDFTDPDRIPGFASKPYNDPSNPEILD
jgi:hypothetical protein